MNKISDKTTVTVVKIFINTLTVTTFVTAPLYVLADPPVAATPPAPAQSPSGTPGSVVFNNGESDNAVKSRTCSELSSSLREANEKISSACRKASMGGDCVQKAKDCVDEETDDSADTTSALSGGSIANSLGNLLGGGAGQIAQLIGGTGLGGRNSKCPQLSGRDYFEQKDQIDKDLKEAKKGLADLDKDRADAKKEYDDAIKKINEDLADAQKKAQEDSHSIDEDLQKQITDFQTAQAQAAKDMRNKKSDILVIQGQLISLDRQKATALIDLTNYSASSDCKKKMYEAYASYKRAVSAGSLSGQTGRGNEKRSELLNIFNKCMQGWDQKRLAVSETFRDQRKQLEKKLDDANADVNAIEESLKQSKDSLEGLKTAAGTKKSEALNQVIQLGERLQKEMQAAYEQFQTKMSGINKQEAALNEEINSLGNKTLTLGPPPKVGTEYAPAQALDDISAGVSDISAIEGQAKENGCNSISKSATDLKKKYGGDN